MIPNEGTGRRKTKLADLPPAARLALVSLEKDGRIRIHLRYVVPPQHQQSVCADERYEFSDSNREDVLDQIYKLRMPREWQRDNRFYISPRSLKRLAEMEEAEKKEEENL